MANQTNERVKEHTFMRVSIIMSVYNSEKYISEAVDSVINQSLSDWELIIIDDGSTDCTGKIADEYSQKDFRIKVFHQSNKGVSAARNHKKLCIGKNYRRVCHISG